MAENTNVYKSQSGTLSFKPTNPGEIRTLNDLHLAMGVMKMPRVSVYWEGGMDIGIFQNTMPRDRFFQLRYICIWSTIWRSQLRTMMCFSRYVLSMMPYAVNAWSFH